MFCVLPTIPDLIIRGLSGQVTLFCFPVISRWREHFSGPSWGWIIAIRMLWWWCWSSSRTPSTMWSVHLKPNSAGNFWTNQPSTLFTSYLIDPLKYIDIWGGALSWSSDHGYLCHHNDQIVLSQVIWKRIDGADVLYIDQADAAVKFCIFQRET